MIRTLIVDDEALARGLVREYLQAHDDIEIVAECDNGFDAVKTITELRPDLIFLDIQMPRLSGLEVLELTQRDHGVIFTTAYDQHALKAFDLRAVDYLLKPFAQARFDEALVRARAAGSGIHRATSIGRTTLWQTGAAVGARGHPGVCAGTGKA